MKMCYETRAKGVQERRLISSRGNGEREPSRSLEWREVEGWRWGEVERKNVFFFHKGTMNLAPIAPGSALPGAAGFRPSHFAGAQVWRSAC